MKRNPLGPNVLDGRDGGFIQPDYGVQVANRMKKIDAGLSAVRRAERLQEELDSLKDAIAALPAVPSWYLKWLGDRPEARAAVCDPGKRVFESVAPGGSPNARGRKLSGGTT